MYNAVFDWVIEYPDYEQSLKCVPTTEQKTKDKKTKENLKIEKTNDARNTNHSKKSAKERINNKDVNNERVESMSIDVLWSIVDVSKPL